ncbi:HAD family hydrolase [Enterococcus avium]|jgi:Cof subfamily protein (haloacid dehalogenase superfamily)|uniref:HAD family hydrolase n=1 Tax=Enterococcus avium TaxID=33945 RepID=UPI0032E44A0C
MKRIIAIDMDGTLLNSRQKISRENVSAIKKRLGKDFIYICSGRDREDIHSILSQAGLSLPVASVNGALCTKEDGDEIFGFHFERAIFDQIMSEVKRYPYKVYTSRGNFSSFSFSTRVKEMFRQYGDKDNKKRIESMEYLINYERSVQSGYPDEMYDLLNNEILTIQKLLIYFPQCPEKALLEKKLNNIPGVSVTASGYDNFEILPDKIDKGKTFDVMISSFGLDKPEKIAIGDSENDLSLFKDADVSVAVNNAMEKIKNLADIIVPSNDEDGVAQFLNRL